ncbi:MAG: hypothetical protein HYW65_03445 [Candidatus Liptonbacteria bacterium]|nr:hypothetical protein [Candidatus Liptonbacteria bacterium]
MARTLTSIPYTLCPRAHGQAALSFVFLVGSIVILVGVTLGFLASSFVNSSFGYTAAQKALTLADAGIRDAKLRLLRNKDLSSPSGYSMPLGDGSSAQVTVTQNSPSTGLVTVVSTATLSFHTKKIQAIFSVTSSTGQVSLVLWKEVQ